MTQQAVTQKAVPGAAANGSGTTEDGAAETTSPPAQQTASATASTTLSGDVPFGIPKSNYALHRPVVGKGKWRLLSGGACGMCRKMRLIQMDFFFLRQPNPNAK